MDHNQFSNYNQRWSQVDHNQQRNEDSNFSISISDRNCATVPRLPPSSTPRIYILIINQTECCCRKAPPEIKTCHSSFSWFDALIPFLGVASWWSRNQEWGNQILSFSVSHLTFVITRPSEMEVSPSTLDYQSPSNNCTWVLKTRPIEIIPIISLKPNCYTLQNISRTVSLKIGSTSAQKLSQIFKNRKKLHNKITRSKVPKYP